MWTQVPCTEGATLYALENDCFKKELDEAKLIHILDDFQLDFKIISGINSLFLNGEKTSKTKLDNPILQSGFPRWQESKSSAKKMVAQQKTWEKTVELSWTEEILVLLYFPDAELKLFVTASAEVRTQRRLDELKNNGVKQNFDEVKNNLSERDYLDSTWKESPLIQTQDAIVLDNSELSIEEQLDWALIKVNEI